MNRPLQGFSLVEVMISLAIFATVLAVVMQTMSSSRDLESMFISEDKVAEDMDRVMRALASDIGQSGWHVPKTLNASSELVVVPLPSLDVAETLTPAAVFALDRAVRYWPMVYGSATTRQATGLPYLTRLSASVFQTSALPTGLPGLASDATTDFAEGAAGDAAYYKSFYAPSQEYCFLKQVTIAWQPKPDIRSEPRLGFPGTFAEWRTYDDVTRAKLQVLYPAGWRNTSGDPALKVYASRATWDVDNDKVLDLTDGERPYGQPMMSAIIDTTSGSSGFSFATQWQTILRSATDTGPLYRPAVKTDADSISNQDGWLRDFAYQVIPSPYGLGRLVRTYRASLTAEPGLQAGNEPGQYVSQSGDSVMKIEAVLSDHVVRIVFDTRRTDHTLSLNQVRAQVYFACRSLAKPEVVITQRLDQVFAMRARNSANDRSSDQKNYFGEIDVARLPVYQR